MIAKTLSACITTEKVEETRDFYVDALEIAPMPVFEDVQASVFENWQAEQQETFNEEFFESLKRRYQIVIESAPLLPNNTDRDDSDIAEENGSVAEPAT